MPVGVVSSALICIGVPLASFVPLWLRRHQLTHPLTQLQYGFLFLPYQVWIQRMTEATL